MSQAEKYLRKVIEDRVTEIHTAMPCRVESFDAETRTAKVIPLFKVKFSNSDIAQDRPPLVNVPAMRLKLNNGNETMVVNTVYEQGDIVIVVFFERAYDFVRDGSIADPKYNRKHALEDGVIIGLL